MYGVAYIFYLICVSNWEVASALIPTWEPAGLDPKTPQDQVVVHGAYRISVLGETLFRVQISDDSGQWDDRQSQSIVNRHVPPVHFESRAINGTFQVHTNQSSIYIHQSDENGNGVAISAESVDPISGSPFTWRLGQTASGNMFGTVRTLDELSGFLDLNCSQNRDVLPHNEDLHCSLGIPSSQGWFVLDDTSSPRFATETGWPAAPAEGRASPNGTDLLDFYISLHGADYMGALKAFARLSGRTAMPPRAPLDVMFCRWYDIGADDAVEIAQQHKLRSLPLSVLIIDMEFHGDCVGPNGWTGYTPDSNTFAPPYGFNDSMAQLLARGLQVGLNLHDADGVHPCEEQYQAMKRALGLPPTYNDPIRFNATDEDYMLALQDIVVQRLVGAGAAVQWTDWQQGGSTGVSIPGWSPTYLLNFVRSSTAARRGENVRSWSLSRYGGMGQHRDGTLGFSGDYERSWHSLRFLPYFSSTATNAYWQWTHDAAGGIPGAMEFNVRWVQAATVSAMYRTHGSGIPLPGGWDWQGQFMPVIWLFPDEQYQSMREAAIRRHEMLPVHYSLWRVQHDTGVGPLRPMYLHYPLAKDAYRNGTVTQQYMLGPDMIVSPVTSPSNPNSSLALWSVWLPGSGLGNAVELHGDIPSASQRASEEWWFSLLQGGMVRPSSLQNASASSPAWNGSTILQASHSFVPLHEDGGGLHSMHVDVSEVPMFVRAGALVPFMPYDPMDTVGVGTRSFYPRVGVRVYPGAAAGSTAFYEDDGVTLAWTNTTTPIASSGDAADTAEQGGALRGVEAAATAPAGASWTSFQLRNRTDASMFIDIFVNGSYDGMLSDRQFQIEVISCMPISAAAVSPAGATQPIDLPFVRHPETSPEQSWYTYDGHNLVATVLTPPLQQPVVQPYDEHILVGSVRVEWNAAGGKLRDSGYSPDAFASSSLQYAQGYARRGALIKRVIDKQVFPSQMKHYLNRTQLVGAAGRRLAGPGWRLAASPGALVSRAASTELEQYHQDNDADDFIATLSSLRTDLGEAANDARAVLSTDGPLAATNRTTVGRVLGLYEDVLDWKQS